MTPLCRGRRRGDDGGGVPCACERARESEWVASLSAVSQLLFVDLLDFY